MSNYLVFFLVSSSFVQPAGLLTLITETFSLSPPPPLLKPADPLSHVTKACLRSADSAGPLWPFCCCRKRCMAPASPSVCPRDLGISSGWSEKTQFILNNVRICFQNYEGLNRKHKHRVGDPDSSWSEEFFCVQQIVCKKLIDSVREDSFLVSSSKMFLFLKTYLIFMPHNVQSFYLKSWSSLPMRKRSILLLRAALKTGPSRSLYGVPVKGSRGGPP